MEVGKEGKVTGRRLNTHLFIFCGRFFDDMHRLQPTFSEYMEGALMGLMTTMFCPAWVCTRLPP